MSKRLLIAIILLILAATGLKIFLARQNSAKSSPPLSEQEIAGQFAELATQSGQTNRPTQAVLLPLDLSQPVRLAIGGLGLADNDQNQQLGDLVTAQLSGAPGFNLVERQFLDAVLRELNLSLFGFVRAKDAVRAGKLLKADWFLLGTEAKINGTNAIIARVVDARTGILRDAAVFPCDKPSVQLATDLAAFMRQSRQNAASSKIRVYLAIGTFEDLSVNNRQADFPAQVRGYLMAAYQGAKVTLLEREYVDVLLREVQLDLAGLTEEEGTNPPPPMQSAFWLVSGQYQSYETTNFQVELNLNVQRIFGRPKFFTIRGLPDEDLNRQIKTAIDGVLDQNFGGLVLSRQSEAHAQMTIGKRIMQKYFTSDPYVDLVFINGDWDAGSQDGSKEKRNVEEAARAFETVLLLEPTNRLAKLYLAACLRKSAFDQPDEARNYYREIIEEPVQDELRRMAQLALVASFEYASPEEKTGWFESAAGQTTNLPARDYYLKQAGTAEDDETLRRGGSPEAERLAEKKLFEEIRAYEVVISGGSGGMRTDMGMGEFVKVFGTNRMAAAQRLVELFPQMKSLAPDLEPFLLAEIVSFQVSTNVPIIAEFKNQFEKIRQQPNQVLSPNYYWDLLGSGIYNWCMKHKFYDLAIGLAAGKFQAVTNFPNHQLWKIGDVDKMNLAYAYLGAQQWDKALDIFETYSNQPVQVGSEGPWGDWNTIVFPGKQAAFCRQKLGQAVGLNPFEFSMGKPLLCLCAPSTFAADDGGLWIGIAGRLLHLDFDLKTNLVINLPMDTGTPITEICVSPNTVWVGTGGDGLIEFDKRSQKCRHYSTEDGLMMDKIFSMHLTEQQLWIGYGSKFDDMGVNYMGQDTGRSGAGGLGWMGLSSRKFTSFTPSMKEGTEPLKFTSGNMVRESISSPTRRGVRAVTVNAKGNAWFATDDYPLRRYRPGENPWDRIADVRCCTSLASDVENLYVGQYWNYSGGDKTGPLGVSVMNFKDGQWRILRDTGGLMRGAVTTLNLDGSTLWVGGMGYIALVDPARDKVLRFANVQAKAVDRIQIGGGYVWAQFDWHLYRAALSDLQ